MFVPNGSQPLAARGDPEIRKPSLELVRDEDVVHRVARQQLSDILHSAAEQARQPQLPSFQNAVPGLGAELLGGQGDERAIGEAIVVAGQVPGLTQASGVLPSSASARLASGV